MIVPRTSLGFECPNLILESGLFGVGKIALDVPSGVPLRWHQLCTFASLGGVKYCAELETRWRD